MDRGKVVPGKLWVAANDVEPLLAPGNFGWSEQWMGQPLLSLFQADVAEAPAPRMAELIRRLEASIARDGRR